MSRKAAITGAIAATFAMIGAGVASAETYTDYAPEAGIWEISAVDVDPNHVDDYLTGLRASEVPAFEILKKHGIIDAYKFVVRTGYNKGNPNVLIMTHYTSPAMLAPDKARDMMIDKEIHAAFSKEKDKAAVAGYEKYRQFVDDALWTEQIMAK